MTMKTKHILLGLSLGLLGGFTACDVTDLNPKDSITDNSYWNTVSDLENYAKGFYTVSYTHLTLPTILRV